MNAYKFTELKSVSAFNSEHNCQLLNYMLREYIPQKINLRVLKYKRK